MAIIKRRNKKYSPYKKAQSTARAFMSNKAVAWCGTKKAQMFNINTLKPARLTKIEALAITEVHHNWNVYLVVLCRDHTGNDYMKVEITETIYSKVDQISDSVQQLLADMVKQQNENHVINIGWVCTPHKEELSDDQIDKMMTTLGAWEFLAKHEVTENTVIEHLEG